MREEGLFSRRWGRVRQGGEEGERRSGEEDVVSSREEEVRPEVELMLRWGRTWGRGRQRCEEKRRREVLLRTNAEDEEKHAKSAW